MASPAVLSWSRVVFPSACTARLVTDEFTTKALDYPLFCLHWDIPVLGGVFATVMERILAKALGQDVTQLAATEKQLLLARLLARLAHEIRNPLSSLDIHVQLLEEDLTHLAPHVKGHTAGRFEIIHGELHRLENIVKHLLGHGGAIEVANVPAGGALFSLHLPVDLKRKMNG